MVRLRERGWRAAELVAAVGTAVALGACGPAGAGGSAANGPDGGPSSGSREARYQRVIEDPHPRPADVVEAAGAPSGVARSGDGSLLLTYDAGNVEDDEGPAATAWRILDPAGRTVAEHAEHTNAEAVRTAFEGVPGGFVKVPSGEGDEEAYGLDVRGERHEVVVTDTPLRTRPGDILLAEPEPTLVYRPATRTMAPPAEAPDEAIDFAVDEQGTIWSLEQSLTDDPHRVVRQRDGRTLGSEAVPQPYAGTGLAARGGTTALALTLDEGVRGLLVTTDDGAHWRTVLDGGIPWKDLDRGEESLVLEVLTDGRLLVGEEGGRYWLADDRGDSTFHELRTPVPFTSFAVHGTTLYGIADATTATYDLVKGEGVWTSRDGGRQWRRLAERG
ncbi:hypothetical protein [Streptomyces stelliscabiei]|uniref:Lipoprotein n=1 Tax=Streptomyces stelliscabiei TaxID=146820 RepID=A0A8I0P3D8_9ACTN|nr:hypothetical protein [Streptomyces stelliscabiei]KND40471.1 lipoprotein [Streptomyces stelliscabiei]MBE1594648.1 hypothetical protein [Streptomyces stelliscabiei]MDX2521124.1 hypothetical protein [Streptomyces stelliscabiei]MDX2550791.1 hypothetical protein [Streptomyces stelliscabiei]MDX2616826.1 hypothetical protein [Streptomyces stelliscabiei]